MKEPLEKIRVSAGEDLLAFIPHMVGYWPEASVVCIGMSGKQLRATMRMDLPPERGDVDCERFAAIAAKQMACDGEADGTLVAIFAREDWKEPDGLPNAELYRELCGAFAEAGLPVRDAWYVGTEHWRSLQCSDASCCPWPGMPNESIKNSFVNAEFVYRGSMVRETPKRQIDELTAVVDATFVRAVAAAGDGVRDLLFAHGAGAEQLATSLGAWEHGLRQWPTFPDAALTAFLLGTLGDVTVRDAAMVAMASTAARALRGAFGLGLVDQDFEEVLFPPSWYGSNQAEAEVDELWDMYEQEEQLHPFSQTAISAFGCILVGDVCRQDAYDVDDARDADNWPDPLDVNGSEREAERGKEDATGEVVGPDWERLDRAEELLQFLARATDGHDKAPVLCILGWIQWCKGRGTWAGHYFAACQIHDPGYRLAGLLDRLLASGYVAECAKNRDTAWRGRGDNEEELGEPNGPSKAA